MKLTTGFWRLIYMPICRTYARHILEDKPADSVMCFLCGLYFFKVNGYWPRFKTSRSFAEKLWNRMLFDRSPQWTVLSDKLCMRDYVAKRAGSEYLVPLFWSGNNPDEIPFDKLPLKFLIKTNHGCEYNIIVKDKMQLDQTKARLQLKKWLNKNFCLDTYLGIAWGYKNIKPAIIIESFVEENGKAPVDYKFWCFDGRVELLTMHFDRFGNQRVKTLDRNFKPYEFKFPLDDGTGEYSRPMNFEDMIKVAESLAENFDFIRVDLYNVNGKIYFGEFTIYPGGVSINFHPTKLDYRLGEKWKAR